MFLLAQPITLALVYVGTTLKDLSDVTHGWSEFSKTRWVRDPRFSHPLSFRISVNLNKIVLIFFTFNRIGFKYSTAFENIFRILVGEVD